MSEKAPAEDLSTLSFEDALSELEQIVRRLEDGSGKLDEAIGAYERGIALQRHCQAKLQEAELRVDRVVLGATGPTGKVPLDVD